TPGSASVSAKSASTARQIATCTAQRVSARRQGRSRCAQLPAAMKTGPKARPEALPDISTKPSAASEKPKLREAKFSQTVPGTWLTKIITSASPRRKSIRWSRLLRGSGNLHLAFRGGPCGQHGIVPGQDRRHVAILGHREGRGAGGARGPPDQQRRRQHRQRDG